MFETNNVEWTRAKNKNELAARLDWLPGPTPLLFGHVPSISWTIQAS